MSESGKSAFVSFNQQIPGTPVVTRIAGWIRVSESLDKGHEIVIPDTFKLHITEQESEYVDESTGELKRTTHKWFDFA